MSSLISCAWETRDRWPASNSTVVAFMRFARNRSRSACPHRHGGELSGQRDEILCRIGRPRRNVDEGGDFRIRSGFADDRTAPGMADHHGGSILQRQRAARRCDGVGERCQRILHRGHMQARRLKARDDLAPGGPVRPGTVHQHHIARLCWP